MESHVTGEKVRQNHHYLKSSLYCSCGSRMLVQHSVNRHGTRYEYFVCSGRHEKRNACTQPAVGIALIENKVVDLYKTIQISRTMRSDVEQRLRRALEASSEDTRKKQHDLLLEQGRLQARSKKLLDGHLDGAVPAELYRDEQERISRQFSGIAERLESTAVTFTTIEQHLVAALDLVENCYEAYRRAPDDIRRRFNQAFFERIVVDQDIEVTYELAEPFRSLQNAAQEITEIAGLENRSWTGQERQLMGMDSALGSRDEHLVLQSDVLANIRKGARPLFNLVRSVEFSHLLAKSVRDERLTFTQVKQLSPAFVDELVKEYRAGASVYDLQKRHGVHRNTIAKHLKHRGIALGVQPLSESEVARAKELYKQRLSLNAIGREMGRDPKTVKSALVSDTGKMLSRSGFRMEVAVDDSLIDPL